MHGRFVAPLDPHLFDSDRCSLARFSFGLRDNPSFSLDGLASIIFEQLNREIPIDGRSTASVTGPFQHFRSVKRLLKSSGRNCSLFLLL